MKDIGSLGRLGAKTLSAYLLTTVLSITIGLAIVNFMQPGAQIEEQKRIENRIQYELWVQAQNGEVIIADHKNLLSDPKYSHLIKDSDYQITSSDNFKNNTNPDKGNDGPLQFLIDMVPENIFLSLSSNKLMLQIIFFSIFFGVSLLFIDESKAKPIVSLVNGINDVFLKMIDWVMKAAPFFVFALMSGVMAKMANSMSELWEIFKGLGLYSLCVIIGLALMIFVIYPLIVRLFGNKNLFYMPFFKKMAPAQFLAFSTSSSAATLPVTMHCVEERIGVSKKISSFVLPIGATVNMDGTSLYQAIAVIFLAQMHLIELDLAQQLTIVLTATLASIGSAAVPSAGLVMLIMVLQSVGLNPMWIAIIFPVDRLLDMCRTTVNVTGDATICTLIAKTEDELKEIK
jgi:Na+/H+-dicarboxylate symporter